MTFRRPRRAPAVALGTRLGTAGRWRRVDPIRTTVPVTLGIALAACAPGASPVRHAPPAAGVPSRAIDAASPRWRLGVNVDPVAEPEQWRALDALPVDAVRMPVRWDLIEPSPGVRRWGEMDRVIEEFESRNIAVVASVQGSPDWARRDPVPDPDLWICSDPAVVGPDQAIRAPPTDAQHLADFAAEVAVRYAGRVAAIEVWPEPNLLPNWRVTGPDPEDYAALLVTVARELRSVAPDVTIVSGALAPTTDVGICFLSDVVFLNRLSATGALRWVDAVGIEPFGLRAPPDQPPDRERLNFRRAELLHAVLEQGGEGDLPLWAMAWGWNAGQDPATSPWGSHSHDTAAEWLQEADAISATWPWLGAAFLWHLRPIEGAPEAVGFALVDGSGHPTPLGAAAAAVARGPPGPAPAMLPPAPRRPWLAAAIFTVAIAAATVATATRRIPRARRVPEQLLAWGASSPRAVAATLVGALAALVASGLGARMVAGAGESGAAAALGTIGLAAWAVLAMTVAARPDWGAAAAIAVAPFYAALAVPLGPRPVGVLEAVTLAVVAGAACAWIGHQRKPRVLPIDWLVLLLVGWSALAVSWAEALGPAFREWRIVLLEPALIYGVLRTAPRRQYAAIRAMDSLVLGAVAVSGLAVAALGLAALAPAGPAAGAPGLVSAEGVMRAAGTYGSPNNLALFAGRAFMAALAMALWSTGRRRRVHAVAAVIVAIGIVATFSRGALFLGLPVAMVTTLVVAVRSGGIAARLARRTALLAVGVLVVFVLAFGRTERLAGILSAEPGSTLHLRLRLWSSAVQMGIDHPILGVGPDNFLVHYRDRYVHRDAVTERSLSHPHNLFLDAWLRLGIPGLLLFATITASALLAAWRGLARPAPARALAAAALGVLVYALAHGLVDNFFFVPDLALAWWVAVAAAVATPAGPSQNTE